MMLYHASFGVYSATVAYFFVVFDFTAMLRY